MKKKYMDLIAGGALTLFALFGWYQTCGWKESGAAGGMSVKFYPRVVFAGLILCGGIILLRTLFRLVRAGRGGAPWGEEVIDIRILRVALTVVLTLIYIFALRGAGFLLATPGFLFLCMLLFGEKRWVRMALISLAGTALLWLFFVRIMGVRF